MDCLEGVTDCKHLAISYQPSGIRYQPSAISHQVSGISHQPSAIRYQVSAISHQPSAISDVLRPGCANSYDPFT
ncbi:MAG: hypothetical protein F6J90_22015 [Moorea sp. SIOASIH]|uniref:hypothetical protein n=1 Tax=Moorena sp. SIOASIH TaxID=2607817 RepID=UPI0013B92AEE|nr:hypothetical protein [Moorena sp. SIOASIH]NEO38867.1 hypothetical protein [Moorena sp. SIOASIH]